MKRRDILMKIEVTLESAISAALGEIGIAAHLDGYDYLRWMIAYAVEHPCNKYMTEYYRNTGKAFGTTASRVERACRYAVEYAFTCGDYVLLGRYFKNTIGSNGTPTNGHFVFTVADSIRLSMERDGVLARKECAAA